jgi:hypothetical protein
MLQKPDGFATALQLKRTYLLSAPPQAAWFAPLLPNLQRRTSTAASKGAFCYRRVCAPRFAKACSLRTFPILIN